MVSKLIPNNNKTLNWIYFTKDLKPFVKMNGANRFLPSYDSLEEKLKELLSLETGALQWKDIPFSLRMKLRIFSQAYLGNQSIYNALDHLGFKYIKRKKVRLKDIEDELKKTFSENELRNYLKTGKTFSLRKELLKTETGRKAYNNKRSTFRKVSWGDLFEKAFPDLTKEYGDIYGLLTNSLNLNEEIVVDWLRNQFYQGKNISNEGLRIQPEKQYLNFMLKNPLDQMELSLDYNAFSKYELSKQLRSYLRRTFSKKGSLFLTKKDLLTQKRLSILNDLIKETKLDNIYVKKYSQLVEKIFREEGKQDLKKVHKILIQQHSDLIRTVYNYAMKKVYAEHPSILVGAEPLTKNNFILFSYLKKAIPEIRPYDIFPSKLMNSRIGRAGQGEVALVMELYRRSQHQISNQFPDLEAKLGSKIKSILINDFNYSKLKGKNEIVPDLELILENEKTVAVEIKRYSSFTKYESRRMIDKYNKITTWPDGTKIDFKLNINMVPGALKEETKKFIEQNDWIVVDGEEYNRLFETVITNLKNNYDDEFHKTRLFLAGEKEEVFEKINEMHDLIINKPYILGRPTNFSKTDFIQNFLMEAAQSLIDEKNYLDAERKEILKLKSVNKWSVDLFKKYYDVKQLQKIPEEHLFFDYETLSFLRNGGLVVVNSNLVKEKEGVFVYTFLTRDPMEESKVAKNQIELIKKNPNLLGFNSSSFDIHYLIEMSLANLLPLPEYNHTDLFHIWKPLARDGKYAHLKEKNKQGLSLQVFEKYVLKNYESLRAEDIPGSEIPTIFEKFYAGKGQLEPVKKSEIHCSFDSISTTFLYLYLLDKKRLTPRQ